MAEITAQAVQEFRKKTGLGLMECKALLKEADGDLKKALTLAKEKHGKNAENRAGRADADAFNSRLPWSTAPFAIVAARLPPVPISATGVTAVSPNTTRMSSNGMPNSSAATWASVVSCPWPWGC